MVKRNVRQNKSVPPKSTVPAPTELPTITLPLPSRSQSKRKQPKPTKMDTATKTLQDIRMLQNTTHLLIPKAPFARLIREIMQNCSTVVDRVTGEALNALHESTEYFLIQLFEDANACTLHRNQVTLKSRDIRLVIFLKNQHWYELLG